VASRILGYLKEYSEFGPKYFRTSSVCAAMKTFLSEELTMLKPDVALVGSPEASYGSDQIYKPRTGIIFVSREDQQSGIVGS
jgi:hypothetical protein